MKGSKFWDVLLKIVVAAITAAATALTTTSCMAVAHSKVKERGASALIRVPR